LTIFLFFFIDYWHNCHNGPVRRLRSLAYRDYLILQPRHFIYKKKQKNRKFFNFNKNCFKRNFFFKFGSAGLLLLQPAQLTSMQIFRFKLFLKRASKKSDITNRFVWFNAFPHLPLTKKPTGTRMGKGKGKLERWFTNVRGGVFLIEFKNLRYGRSKYFMTQMTHKLGLKTKKLFQKSFFLNLPLYLSKKSPFRAYW
jgi:large subunit ribosomal protein L16